MKDRYQREIEPMLEETPAETDQPEKDWHPGLSPLSIDDLLRNWQDPRSIPTIH